MFNFNYYFNIGLIYTLVGFSIALISYFVFKKNVIGKFWGAFIVAMVGSFLGGVFGNIFEGVIELLSNINNSVNIFPPIITSVILLWIFVKVSEKR